MIDWGSRPFDEYIRDRHTPAIPDGDCGPSLDDYDETFCEDDFILDGGVADVVPAVSPLPVQYQLNAVFVKGEGDYSWDMDFEDVPKERQANIPGPGVQKKIDCRTLSRCQSLCVESLEGTHFQDSHVDSIGMIEPNTSLSPVDGFLYQLRPAAECPASDLDIDSYGYPALASPISSGPLQPPLWPISSYNIGCDNDTYIPSWIPSLPLNRIQRPKHVYFAGSPTHSVHISEHSVPPYCEVYGEHPSGFEFGPRGERVPTSRNISYVAVIGEVRGHG